MGRLSQILFENPSDPSVSPPVGAWLDQSAPFRTKRRKRSSWITHAALSVLLSKVHMHWWKHEGEALRASLRYFCPDFAGSQVAAHCAMAKPVESLQNGLAVASSHSHQTQRLCGSACSVSHDSGVPGCLTPQMFESSRFKGEIRGDRNLSSQLRAPVKSRAWHGGPNAEHNQSDSCTRVGVRGTTMVVYQAAFVAVTVGLFKLFHRPLQHYCLCKCAVFRSSQVVSNDSGV